MAGALGPAVRGARSIAQPVARNHVVGLWLGATLTGLTLALAGVAVQAAHLQRAAFAIAWAAVGFGVLEVLGLRPVQSSWQVPERWTRQIEVRSLAVVYGFFLGFGVWTAVVVSAFWCMIALTTVVRPAMAIAAWLLYATGRGAAFIVASMRFDVEDLASRQRSRRFAASAALAVSLAAVSTQTFLGA